MAELEIGQHCQVTSCKLLDFLPIRCHFCDRVFCKDHSSTDCHNCTETQTKVSQHLQVPGKEKAIPCSVGSCCNKELVAIICEHCEKHFCLGHRHQQEHGCPLLLLETKESKTAQHVKKILSESKQPVVRKIRGAKSKKTAAKVALMKIKLHAVGNKNLPEMERFYLRVVGPAGGPSKSKPIIFSKKWTIGKVIDVSAELFGLSNKNNVRGCKKLRLFEFEDGSLVSIDMGKTLDQLETEGFVFNGGTLILEYVDENCSQLDDIECYTVAAS